MPSARSVKSAMVMMSVVVVTIVAKKNGWSETDRIKVTRDRTGEDGREDADRPHATWPKTAPLPATA